LIEGAPRDHRHEGSNMSAPDLAIRRADLVMDAERAEGVLSRGYAGRLATTGADGWPYVVPLLYVWTDRTVYVHNSHAAGHLSRNIDGDGRACFLVDEPGSVYGYGRFQCDTALSYCSVMVFGSVERVSSHERKTAFCDELMRKYGSAIEGRPANVYPRLDHISVYALRSERISGKEITLPAVSAQWPAIDRTRSPDLADPVEQSGTRAGEG
jgi:nitroimidazol reductase NimA-like FMN-containing flavoprotein (pyridoxamine 5'-phosphate oxidase superfamily)